jgi:pimeloyl-ACP methyl ester carboxylesterase
MRRIIERRQLLSASMRRRAPLQILAALLPAIALAGAPATSQASGDEFTPCPKDASFSCVSLAVPLDRTGSLSGTVELSVERRLAGPTPSKDAVVALAGGPGQAALPLASFVAQAIAPALATRDLLLFDQRGTGGSDPLNCSALTSAAPASASSNGSELVSQCATELGPARGDFTTRESVADIEALRQAGGYEKLVLYGTSYGTKVALDYAARYPQHVEALVLDSTETPDGPEAFHVSTFKAMKPVLAELCSHHACDGVTRNPVGDVARLVGRLASGASLAGHAYDGHGHAIKLSVTRSDLYGLLLAGDLDPALRAQVPAAVHAALGKDPGPLLRLVELGGVRTGSEESSGVNVTLFVDTSCEETPFPWQRSAPQATRAVEAEAALNALPGSDFYPFDREDGLLDQTIPLCIAWPDASPPAPPAGPMPNVPTLIFSGGQDLRTPTANARAVARLIPDAQIVTVPYTGHSVIGSDFTSCAGTALATFFAGTPVSACHPGPNPFPPAPAAPLSVSGLATTGGVPGSAGRTLSASVKTIRDLERMVVVLGISFGEIPVGARFGGLRGGDASVTKTGVALNHYTYLPGVQLSGTIPTNLLLKAKGSTAGLTVRGGAAAAGHLSLSSGHRVSGELGGRRFTVNIGSPSSAKAAVAQASWPQEPASLPFGGHARIP